MTDFFKTGLTQQQFLDQYWQKKPLLIRQAYTDFISPISPEELAGLACEPEIESRLIQEYGDKGSWQLDNGPFTDETFVTLGDSHWTLLVQDADKHLPDLAAMMDPFRFIPDWRLDDLMISYAVERGSVGPHTDGYDVFLLQAHGQRQWQINNEPVLQAELIEDIDLRILQEFKADQQWVLEPGDILYLPPHFAHHGVALNDCMTFSIGFRGPNQVEILDALTSSLLEKQHAPLQYQDGAIKPCQYQHKIDGQVGDKLKQLLHELIDKADQPLMEAFGKLVTETKASHTELVTELADEEEITTDRLDAEFESDNKLIKNPYLRFAWHDDEDKVLLFIAGEVYSFSTEDKVIVVQLAEQAHLTQDDWAVIRQLPQIRQVFCQLLAEGVWYWQQDEG